jgi:hypothetical protein
MLQVALAGSQPLGDLVEAARPVGRTHGDKLALAGEAARMALGSTLFHGHLELSAQKQTVTVG